MQIFLSIFYFFYYLILSLLPLSTYTEGVLEQPVSFLPSQALSQNDIAVSRIIFRGLFTYDIYGTLIPDLAESWEISEDGLIYTIKIKDNQYWSNGKKISSEDIIYTASKLSSLNGVVANDKIDDLTVRFILPNKFSPFLSLLTIGIMPQDSEEKYNPIRPVSSGKYKIAHIEKRGPFVKKIILVSSDRKENFRKLVFSYYTNENELITATKLSEIDGFLSQNSYSLPNYTNYKFPLQGIYYSFYFNLRNEKLKNNDLRLALARVLDVNSLIYDKGITVEGPISRSTFTNSSIEFNKYLKEFNQKYNDTELTITMSDIESQYDFIRRIRDIWEDKLDIKVNIRRIPIEDMATFVIEPRDFEILFYGQEVSRDPDRYVNWHSSQIDYPGLNLSGYNYIRADRALEEGRNSINSEDRNVHYKEFQKSVVDQIPAIFMYHPFLNYYVTNRVKGIGQKYTFTPYDRFLDFSNWTRVVTN